MPHAMPSLIAVGPWELTEFAAVRREVDPRGEWPCAATLGDVVRAIAAGGTPPELILLAQPRPGVDDPEALEELRRTAPLTRVIVVAGAWCEGELRTGRPLPGVVRLYWYELAPWWRAACAAIARGATPAWSAPLDEPRAGQMSAYIATPVGGNELPVSGNERGAIAVDAVDFAVFETLAEALSPWGWRCEWMPRHRPQLCGHELASPAPVAGIWDGGQLSDHELASLTAFAAATRPAPVVALLDFPRVEHFAAVQAAGGAATLAKPYQVAHLVNELDQLLAEGQ